MRASLADVEHLVFGDIRTSGDPFNCAALAANMRERGEERGRDGSALAC